MSARAELELLPTDVIWAIDTSGSMTASFPAIRQALDGFSARVSAAGIDARIVLLAGSDLCVPPPVGSGSCGAGVGGIAADSREPGFLHLDLPFGANAGVPTILDNYESYKRLLRAEARTQLVLTEDGAPQATAAAVTDHIEGRGSASLTPPWSPGLRPGSYQWNGVVCPNGTGPGACFISFAVPQTTLDLIAATGGLLGDLGAAGTQTDPFADLLDRLAEAVIVGATVRCDYDIPPPPPGETFDRNLVNVNYTASAGGATTIPRLQLGAACGTSKAWTYDNETQPSRVVLCPSACEEVQADPEAQIDVLFGCDTVVVLE